MRLSISLASKRDRRRKIRPLCFRHHGPAYAAHTFGELCRYAKVAVHHLPKKFAVVRSRERELAG